MKLARMLLHTSLRTKMYAALGACERFQLRMFARVAF